MYKKGQGVSITVVIIAALALLVLVVLSSIFITRLGKTQETVDRCESYGGRCFSLDEGCEAPYSTPTTAYKCMDITRKEKENEICCLRI